MYPTKLASPVGRHPDNKSGYAVEYKMSRWTKKARPPVGYDYIQPVMDALDSELREKMNEPHEGRKEHEILWPIHQINWQRSRYVYDMFYKYKKIPREVYDYCIKRKLIDAPLIAKWKKKGYEKLCSTHAIDKSNFNFNTVCVCRVPRKELGADQRRIQSTFCGCLGCASGKGGRYNIFGNKYGQYLAEIQIKREEAEAAEEAAEIWAENEDEEEQKRGEKRSLPADEDLSKKHKTE